MGKEFVLDVGKPTVSFPARLKMWISDPSVIVVLHGARSDRIALERIGVRITNLFDTQVAHEVLTGEQSCGLARVLKHWLNVGITKDSPEMKKFMAQPGGWADRPLPPYVIEYAANDVKYLPQLYDKMVAEANRRRGQGLLAMDTIRTCSNS